MTNDTRFFAIIMILTIACSGITWHPTLAWDKVDKAMLAGMVGCQLADTGSTVYALHHGFREANPLLPNNSGGIVAIKVAVIALVAVAASMAKTHKSRRVMLGIVAAGGCGPAAWNIAHF